MPNARPWLLCFPLLLACGPTPRQATAPLATDDPAPTAVTLRALRTPSPLLMNGRAHLVWELLMENQSRVEVVVERVDIAPGELAPLSFEGDALASRMRWLTDVDGETLADLRASIERTRTEHPQRIPPHRGAAFFGWLEAAPDTPLPAELVHRVTLAGHTEPLVARVEVSYDAPRVLGPPLRGRGWLSFGSPGDEGAHRRTILRFSGEYFLAQRYAIDFGGIDANGRLLREGGDAHTHADYAAYGAEVVAVSDGEVVRVHDGVPEQSGENVARAVPITLETVAGNHVIVALDAGGFGVFAHLVPGSVTVREGQRVSRGQPLGRLGSSGNATGPHLHFHLCDRPELLACEGVPYVLDRFGATPFLSQGETLADTRFSRASEPLIVERELVRDERILDFAP